MRPLPTRRQDRLRRLVGQELRGIDGQDPGATWSLLSETGIPEAAARPAGEPHSLGLADVCLVYEEVGAALCDDRFFRGALLAVDLWGAGSATEKAGRSN